MSNYKFNWAWTEPHGKAAYVTHTPVIRIGRATCSLNHAALELLPIDTTHIDVGVDAENRAICIRKSANYGRKLSKRSSLGTRQFGCDYLLNAFPDITKKAYRLTEEEGQLIARY